LSLSVIHYSSKTWHISYLGLLELKKFYIVIIHNAILYVGHHSYSTESGISKIDVLVNTNVFAEGTQSCGERLQVFESCPIKTSLVSDAMHLLQQLIILNQLQITCTRYLSICPLSAAISSWKMVYALMYPDIFLSRSWITNYWLLYFWSRYTSLRRYKSASWSMSIWNCFFNLIISSIK
jgi:hypothetical protein